MKVKKIPVPAGSLIGKMLGADYTDAFRVEFERDIPASADDLSVAFWTDWPTWVERLFRWRKAVRRAMTGLWKNAFAKEGVTGCSSRREKMPKKRFCS